MERCRRTRPPAPLVYVTSFGSHRCGSVIRLGRGSLHSPGHRSLPSPGLRSLPSPGHRSRHSPGLRSRHSPGHRSRHSPSAAPEPQAEPGPGREGRPGSRAPVHLQEAEAKAHTFDFPIPSRNVDKAIKRKKKKFIFQSKVWHKVWKVISKMLEENERFRSRLLACSQFDGEGSGMNQASQNGPYLDREESIFGWV